MSGADEARAVESTEPDRPVFGVWFWIGLVVGWAVIAYGVWGALDQDALTQPPKLARWVIGTLLVHDLLVASTVTLLGLVLARFLPRGIRGPVGGGLVLSGLVIGFSYPLWRGFGRRELNATALPLDYTRNVVVVVAAIWLVVAAVLLARRRRPG